MYACEVREVRKIVQNCPKVASPKNNPILDLHNSSELYHSDTIIERVLQSVGSCNSVGA
jgi:hypothetical protein